CMFLTLCTFLLNDTAPTEIYTLSLHDALPILFERINDENDGGDFQNPEREHRQTVGDEELNERGHHGRDHCQNVDQRIGWQHDRSEEHTSELQSLTNLVCRLLLGKKKEDSQRL